MVAAPLILRGTKKFQTKIIRGDLTKKLNFVGGAKCKGGPNILGGPMNPNDVMVHSVHFGNEIWLEAQPPCRKRGGAHYVVDIFLCLLVFRLISIHMQILY